LVVAVVVLAAVVAAAIVGAWSRARTSSDPVEPRVEERWLVTWLLRHPRWGRQATWLDRNVVGGLLLVIALATLLVVAVVVGWLLDSVRSGSGLAGWDRSVADWGSHHATDTSTAVLDAVTDLGGSGYLLAAVIVVAVADVARRRNVHVVLFLGAVLGGVVLVNNALKWLVLRERPDVPHLVGASGSSFPSGHSAAATATWFALALVVSRRWSRRGRVVAAVVAAAIAVTVAASRALLGVHWLTDVLAGVMVGWGWFTLCALVFGGRVQRLGSPADTVAAVSTAAASQLRSGGDGEHRGGPAPGLAALEGHRRPIAGELEDADVIGEERAVDDLPARRIRSRS
jgi:membrane-associated phospholipid phosphatase